MSSEHLGLSLQVRPSTPRQRFMLGVPCNVASLLVRGHGHRCTPTCSLTTTTISSLPVLEAKSPNQGVPGLGSLGRLWGRILPASSGFWWLQLSLGLWPRPSISASAFARPFPLCVFSSMKSPRVSLVRGAVIGLRAHLDNPG